MTETSAFSTGRIAELLTASSSVVVGELAAVGSESGWRPEVAEWSANECVGQFATLRAESVALVRALRPEDLGRVGIHPDVGPLRVDELIGEWVHHDRNHIRQMLAVTQARVWPQMGNAKRFFLENL